MAIDWQADVVLTSSAGMVASTKLLPFGLESQNNRLGSGTERSTNCSTGLVKPTAPRKAVNAWPGVCHFHRILVQSVPNPLKTVNKMRSMRRFSLKKVVNQRE